MQSDLAQQSIPVRQFTGLFTTEHIGHQHGTRDHTVFEGLYNSPVGLRALIPKSSMIFRDRLGMGIFNCRLRRGVAK